MNIFYSWPAQALITLCYLCVCKDICGGTLVDETTVVTAAHCFNVVSQTYIVYFGLQNSNGKTAKGVVKIASAKIILVLFHFLFLGV